MRKLVAVCTPCREPDHQLWCMNWQKLLLPANYSTVRLFEIGKPVAEARNALVTQAFSYEDSETELSHIFWLDDDVMPDPRAIVQLMYRQKDIVSGVYFTKDEWSVPLWYSGAGEGTKRFVPGVFEQVGGHGMGLTLVRANVYRQVAETMAPPPDSNGNPSWYHTFNSEIVFSQGRTGVISMTEDFFFLDLARRSGFETWIDSSRYAFGWHVDRETGQAYPKPQWKEYCERGTITWELDGGSVVTWDDNPSKVVATT